MCSKSPVSLVITGLPVAHLKYAGCISFVAASLATHVTEAPCRINSLASSIDLYAATLPVIHKTIFLPLSSTPSDPTISKEGCFGIFLAKFLS